MKRENISDLYFICFISLLCIFSFSFLSGSTMLFILYILILGHYLTVPTPLPSHHHPPARLFFFLGENLKFLSTLKPFISSRERNYSFHRRTHLHSNSHTSTHRHTKITYESNSITTGFFPPRATLYIDGSNGPTVSQTHRPFLRLTLILSLYGSLLLQLNRNFLALLKLARSICIYPFYILRFLHFFTCSLTRSSASLSCLPFPAPAYILQKMKTRAKHSIHYFNYFQ